MQTHKVIDHYQKLIDKLRLDIKVLSSQINQYAYLRLVVFALAIIRPFRLTEWLVLIMGILLPFYFIFTYVFLTDSAQAFTLTDLPELYPELEWEVVSTDSGEIVEHVFCSVF